MLHLRSYNQRYTIRRCLRADLEMQNTGHTQEQKITFEPV